MAVAFERFLLYDTSRKAWRTFGAEPLYQVRCGNAMHQFALGAGRCACGQVMSVQPERML